MICFQTKKIESVSISIAISRPPLSLSMSTFDSKVLICKLLLFLLDPDEFNYLEEVD